ncbi:uncharacterized protein LOC143292779 [Babylonia areolata]|uniref:uncharacterized protein LOC143292779 n=1 Tax=Babylonia areolata TaxID=304850 RepID=UPI003FD65234
MSDLSSSEVEEGAVLVYGSPLLEIIVRHPSAACLLHKYGLEPNNSIFAEDRHLPLYQELEEEWSESVQYVVGGAALNVARTVQWLVRKPSVTTFFGGLGRDRHGDILRTQVSGSGVKAMYHVTESQPTGTCVTICAGDNRSMVSRMAGAGTFTEHQLQLDHHWTLVDTARVFYTVSYNLANNPSVLFRLARHAAERRKTFCLNLSAPFLCRRYKESLCRLLPFVHFLFGNQAELDEFGKVHGLQGGRGEVVKTLAAWQHVDKDRPLVVVITQGADPVLVATEGRVTQYPVPCVRPEDIVDTSGAGDAFVGGFLAQLIRHQGVEECVRCGLYASSVVLGHPGCSFPPTPPDYDEGSTPEKWKSLHS